MKLEHAKKCTAICRQKVCPLYEYFYPSTCEARAQKKGTALGSQQILPLSELKFTYLRLCIVFVHTVGMTITRDP
jgi:hypothetical protein